LSTWFDDPHTLTINLTINPTIKAYPTTTLLGKLGNKHTDKTGRPDNVYETMTNYASRQHVDWS